MDAHMLNTITNFIWGIADDCLSDVYVRGKYRDVVELMTDLVFAPIADQIKDTNTIDLEGYSTGKHSYER